MSERQQWAVALDVGGSSVKSGLVDAAGRLAQRPQQTAIDSSAGADVIIQHLAACVGQAVALLSATQEVVGVAIGFPGPFDYGAGISYIREVAKYESLYGRNVGVALREALASVPRVGGLPILFRNDAEAAIVGEALFGSGQGYERLIGLTLGTGCGSAFLRRGAPVVEGPGVPPHGWLYPLPVGKQRADDRFSIRGLRSSLEAAGVSEDIPEAAAVARADGGAARSVFTRFGRDLGDFLQPWVVRFGADAVLLQGGISAASDLFGGEVAQRAGVPAVVGQLGVNAALLGAAALFFYGPGSSGRDDSSKHFSA